jgi:hypothetical protein
MSSDETASDDKGFILILFFNIKRVFLELPGALSNTTRKLLGGPPPDLAASATMKTNPVLVVVNVVAVNTIDMSSSVHTDVIVVGVRVRDDVIVFFMVTVLFVLF